MTIKLNGSTAGSVALDAPASTTSNADITFTLPVADGTAGQVLMTDGSGNLSWVTLPIAGLAMADMWRISTSLNGVQSATDITSNWERVDTDGYGQIGTGMTESSGIFTFPSTGIYSIDFRGRGAKGNGEVQYAGIKILVTMDNSSYNEAANSFNGSGGTGYQYAISCQHIFDVTNTSTHKVKFQFEASHPADLHGNSTATETGVSFIRLGDT